MFYIFDIIFIIAFIFSQVLTATIYGFVIIPFIWRLVCLFRKKGSCKFTKCPLRKDYGNHPFPFIVPDIFPFGSCTKCPPTKEELECYKNSLQGFAEEYLKKKKKGL